MGDLCFVSPAVLLFLELEGVLSQPHFQICPVIHGSLEIGFGNKLGSKQMWY